MEEAAAGLRDARESLKIAEERLGAYLQGTMILPPGATFVDLKAEVTRCTSILASAQETLKAFAAQSTIISSQSSTIYTSCKSQSISGRCSSGRHTDRNYRMQRKFKKSLIKRDNRCIATGLTEGLVAAHIIPLNKSELPRDMLYSPRNGVLLHKTLEDDYDGQMWFFDYDGNITVLYSNWFHRNAIRHVNISKHPETGPSKELIELHNRMALEQKQHYCPYCWKYVGAVNIENHTLGSCSEKLGDENEDNIEDINDDDN